MGTDVNLDQDLENGPKRDRSITDCVFGIIMLTFWGGTIALMAYAFTKGDPAQLVQTYDYQGTPCGRSANGTQNYTLTYFFQPLVNYSNVVCVSKCPTWAQNETTPTSVSCYNPNITYNAKINLCQSNQLIDMASMFTNFTLINSSNFAIYNTTTLFNRFCVPSLANATAALISSFNNVTLATQTQYYFQQYLADIILCWKYFLATMGIAIGVSIISLVFVRCCAGVLVWVILLLYVAAVFCGAAFCGYEYGRIMGTLTVSQQNSSNSDYKTAQNFYIAEICLYIWGGISVLIILFSIHSIAVSIAVIKTSAMFVFSNFLVIFIPLLSALFIAGYVILWIYVFVWLWSVGTVAQGQNSPFATVTWSQSTQLWVIFHVFALLWNVAFLHYYAHFVVASTCAIWYFNAGKSQNGFFSWPILTSAWWGLRYHLGSLAFGSFILAVCWLIQMCLMYIQGYLKKLQASGVDSRVAQCAVSCIGCCVNCCTRFIEFISELGFSQVAITSKNFCASCGEAFSLLASNPLKFGLVNWVSSTFVFIGKLFVATVSGVLGYIMITNDSAIASSLYETVIPTIFFVIIGYVIGAIFYSVFGSSANTILLCFFVDKELAERSGRPPNAPEPMREFYEKYKKPPE